MSDCKKCKGSGVVTVYDVAQPFNPGSSPQKLALLRHYGIKPPKKRGTDNETSEAKYLKRYAKKFPVFASVIDCQQRDKLISTYMWQPNKEGRITTQYGFNPSTWRKSSRSVNLQNIPKRSDLAHLFRRMLVASPGTVLIEADSSAIEAVLVGFCAGDAHYIQMAKRGIHDFVAAKWVGSADTSSKFIKSHYPAERESAKRGVHGSNYLLTPYGLNDEYPEFFPTRRKAEEFQEFYFGLFPKLRLWHQSTLERAHKETFLDNHFQYRHYFYSIFSYNKRSGKWELGDDAKRSVAFVPQSDASALQTEYLLQLASDPTISPYLRLIIHDSFVLEVPESEVDHVARQVHQVMTSPIPALGGLSIGAEVSAGPDLGSMEVLDLTPKENSCNSTAAPSQPDLAAPSPLPQPCQP